MPSPFTLPVRENLAETRRARVLRLDLEGHAFPFRAGQAVLAGLHGQPDRRPYSIASSPEDVARDGWFELLVQIDDDGRIPPHLPQHAGARMDIEGPIGHFTFPEHPPERQFLFVAGGTGIAPLRAMWRHALAVLPHAGLSVLYSARTPDEFAYGTELRNLVARGRIQLRQTITRAEAADGATARGRIDRAALASMLSDAATLCFVCGPDALVQDIRPILMDLGIASERIRTDEWASPL